MILCFRIWKAIAINTSVRKKSSCSFIPCSLILWPKNLLHLQYLYVYIFSPDLIHNQSNERLYQVKTSAVTWRKYESLDFVPFCFLTDGSFIRHSFGGLLNRSMSITRKITLVIIRRYRRDVAKTMNRLFESCRERKKKEILTLESNELIDVINW